MTPLPVPEGVLVEQAWLSPKLAVSPAVAQGDLRLVEIKVRSRVLTARVYDGSPPLACSLTSPAHLPPSCSTFTYQTPPPRLPPSSFRSARRRAKTSSAI